jgi:copper chaperone NosL
MKKLIVSLFAIIAAAVVPGAATAQEGHVHTHGEADAIQAQADIKRFPDCVHCGMDRQKFAHSRMLVTYADGSAVGTCSLTCVVTEKKKNPGKKTSSVQVADYNAKKLLDAGKAVWVIGGKRPGVMTPVAKWAFETRKDADKFIKANGGKVAVFDEALKKAEGEY